MKYYFDPEVGVRAFELDGSQDFLITDAMRPLTDEEIKIHVNPVLTEEEIQKRKNFEAREYLASTDWYVIRMQETGEAIPKDVLTSRKAARESIKEI